MFSSRFFGLSLPVAALLGLAALPAAAQTYNAANGFSDTSYTNGNWSYGFETTLGTGFTLYDTPFDLSSTIQGVQSSQHLGDPSVFKNISNSPATYSDITLAPGQLAFHPGPGDQYSVIRFTAPSAGLYDVAGSFSSATTAGVSSDVHILKNGNTASQLYGPSNLTGYPTSQPFSSSNVFLTQGGTIDFAVGFGANGNYNSDSTALDATITVAPEPSQVAPFVFLALGLGAMVVLKKKKAGAAA